MTRAVVLSSAAALLLSGLILDVFVYVSLRVFAPFASLMLWGLILAVALEPLHGRLADGTTCPPGWLPSQRCLSRTAPVDRLNDPTGGSR